MDKTTGGELFAEIQGRNKPHEIQSRTLEDKGRITRFLILLANPRLKGYLEFKDAMDSIPASKLSAAQHGSRNVLLGKE